MNQPTEEMQKDTDQVSTRKWSRQKKQAVAAVIVTLLAVMVVPVLAWLYNQRNIQTITKINAPYALEIGAGDAREIEKLELSDIDVSGEPKYKDVVFCVFSSKRSQSYHLELAHTTNIGFTYTIYPASKNTQENALNLSQVSYLEDTFYFNTDEPVKAAYLNQIEGTSPARAQLTGTPHNLTYAKSDGSNGDYTNVQPYAEPLYMKTTTPLSLPESRDGNGNYIDYFVLRISWDSRVLNNKETDMVYLMAAL